MKFTKKTLTNLLLVLFAVAVFALIGFKMHWVSTWNSIKSANIWWLLSSAVVMLASHWLRGARWTLLTEPAGYKLNNRRSFYSVMSGYLVNVATSRGGEIARSLLTARAERVPVELLIGTVVTERLVDFVMLFIVCIATLILQREYITTFFDTYIFNPLAAFATPVNIVIALLLLVLAILALRFLLKRKKPANADGATGIKGLILRFTYGLKTIFQLQSPAKFIAYSFGIWIGYWISTYCVMQSLDVTSGLNIWNALSVVIFASIGIAIPLPAGAGVWAAVAIGLQTVYGLSTAASETYGIFTLAVSNINMILFGAICYLLLYLEMQKIAKNDS